MKRLSGLMALMVLALSVMSWQAQAQNNQEKVAKAITAVPDNPLAVVVIPSLDGFEAKVQSWAKAMQEAGLDVNPDEINFSEPKGELMLGDSVDLSAPVVMVIKEGIVEGGDEEVQTKSLFIVQLKDAAAFKKAIGVEGEGVQEVNPELVDENGFEEEYNGYTHVLVNGNTAIFSSDAGALKLYKPNANVAQTLAAMGSLNLSVVSESDLFGYVNIAKWKEASKEDLEAFYEEMQENLKEQMEMQKEMGMAGGEMEAVMGQMMIDMIPDLVNRFMDDGSYASVGYKMDDEGVMMSVGVQFINGSKFGNLFKDAPKEVKFDRLPQVPYYMANATSVDAKPLAEFAKPIIDELMKKNENEDLAKMLQLYEETLAAAGKVKSVQGAMIATKEPDLTKLFQMMAVYETSDPMGVIELQKKQTKVSQELIEKMAKDQDMPAPYTVEYTENLVDIEGRRVDQYAMTFNEDMMAQMGPMGAVIGNGFRYYLSPGKDNLVMGLTKDLQMMKSMLAASSGNGDFDQDAGITSVRKQLRGNRGVEFYLNFGTMFETAAAFAKAQGQELPMQMDPNMQPLAVSASQTDGGAVVDIYLSKKTYLELAKVGMQFGPMLPMMFGGAF